jgi:hypothetical protein
MTTLPDRPDPAWWDDHAYPYFSTCDMRIWCVARDDWAFFKRNPGRSFTLRPAAPVELGKEKICESSTPMPQGWARFTVVYVESGWRLRTIVLLPDYANTDLSDTDCAMLWCGVPQP